MSNTQKQIEWDRQENDRRMRWYQLGWEYEYQSPPWEADTSSEQSDVVAGTPEEGEASEQPAESASEPTKSAKAKDIVASIEEADSADQVVALLGDDERKTVQEAASKKLADLEE